MPELPEVETIKNTLISHVVPCLIKQVRVHYPYLRYPVNDNITNLNGSIIRNVIRVAKYLIIITDKGNVIMHFGMSGCLRFATQQSLTLGKHDHIHFRLANDRLLIFNDPRRFGLIKYIKGDYMNDALLRHLGIDPLTEYLQSKHLWKRPTPPLLHLRSASLNTFL
jgi:formamidopyrimidine-DNA glycosylase